MSKGSFVIFNGDDFGLSHSINQAIIRSYRKGVLTSASLMVSGEAFEEAVIMARKNPGLAVGLHLVLADGKAVLPYSRIPHVVNKEGNFPSNPFLAGLNYFFNREARKEIELETAAQFELFARTGLPMDHVNGHCMMHLHPSVLGCVIRLARRYGARGIRVPRDSLIDGMRSGLKEIPLKLFWAISFWFLGRAAARRIRGSCLCITERTHGLLRSGQMEESYVTAALRRLGNVTAEFYFHPSLRGDNQIWGANHGDLETLLSPKVKEVIRDLGIRSGTYQTLARGRRS